MNLTLLLETANRRKLVLVDISPSVDTLLHHIKGIKTTDAGVERISAIYSLLKAVFGGGGTFCLEGKFVMS